MLNLLFISNSPKMDFIKKHLQPMLKVKIDVVADFDHGLKDVFEKRPATVIIQDQISGVTGESVARHIQMLLGSGAPVFVMLHEGSSRIKPIKGLFEHMVDLTHPDTVLVEDILIILKSIFGPEWEKSLVKPKNDAAALAASLKLSDENRVDAERLVDDFLSDLGTTDKSFQEVPAQPVPAPMVQPVEEPFEFESSADEMARLLIESARQTNAQDPAPAPESSIRTTESEVPVEPPQAKAKSKTPRTVRPSARKPASQTTLPEVAISPEAQDAAPDKNVDPETVIVEQPVLVEPKVTISATVVPGVSETVPQADGGGLNPVPPSPADFKINPVSQQIQEQIPEDLLLAFEENYRSQTSVWKRFAITGVVITGLVAAGWIFNKQKPGLFSFMNKDQAAQKTSPPATVSQAALPVAKSQSEQQKQISTVRRPAAAVTSQLPSFMSTASRDVAFSTNKPGWERYVGKVYEYRIFRADGKIKAVQVLAGIGTQTVDDKFLVTVLREFVGNADYSVGSRDKRQNFLVQRASVGEKADLLIYRSIKTGAIRAFVVSVN